MRDWIECLKRLRDRLFPIHTHCAACGEKLARPSNFDLCQKCNASY